jgi:hypothetical protein
MLSDFRAPRQTSCHNDSGGWPTLFGHTAPIASPQPSTLACWAQIFPVLARCAAEAHAGRRAPLGPPSIWDPLCNRMGAARCIRKFFLHMRRHAIVPAIFRAVMIHLKEKPRTGTHHPGSRTPRWTDRDHRRTCRGGRLTGNHLAVAGQAVILPACRSLRNTCSAQPAAHLSLWVSSLGDVPPIVEIRRWRCPP